MIELKAGGTAAVLVRRETAWGSGIANAYQGSLNASGVTSLRSCETGRLVPGKPSGQRDEPEAVGRDEGRVLGRAKRWLTPARSYVHGWPGGHHVWRIGIAVVGLAVVITGIVLLILPGPGWLVIFLGFAIWATEFAWADAVATFVRRQITRCSSWIRRQPRWLLVAVGAVCLVAVALGIVVLLRALL